MEKFDINETEAHENALISFQALSPYLNHLLCYLSKKRKIVKQIFIGTLLESKDLIKMRVSKRMKNIFAIINEK